MDFLKFLAFFKHGININFDRNFLMKKRHIMAFLLNFRALTEHLMFK